MLSLGLTYSPKGLCIKGLALLCHGEMSSGRGTTSAKVLRPEFAWCNCGWQGRQEESQKMSREDEAEPRRAVEEVVFYSEQDQSHCEV